MTPLLTIWMLFGGAIGLVHGTYTYRQIVAESSIVIADHPVASHFRACYFTLWTLGLWILFGGLIAVLWLISIVAYGIAKPLGWRM